MESKNHRLAIGLCFIGAVLSWLFMQHVAIARARYWLFGVSNFLFFWVLVLHCITQMVDGSTLLRKTRIFLLAGGMILFYIGLCFPFLIILRQVVF